MELVRDKKKYLSFDIEAEYIKVKVQPSHDGKHYEEKIYRIFKIMKKKKIPYLSST